LPHKGVLPTLRTKGRWKMRCSRSLWAAICGDCVLFPGIARAEPGAASDRGRM
jgi:hypothetical protein